MSLKFAVLGLVIERGGHGYDLVQRFERRIGPAWQLNRSAIYGALDQLAGDDLVRCASDPAVAEGGQQPRRHPRVIYVATPGGVEAFDAWLAGPAVGAEPLRSELDLKLALARPDQAAMLLDVIAHYERACIERRDAWGSPPPLLAAESAWELATASLLRERARRRLEADLTWIRDVREAVATLGQSAASGEL
jgi:DNA-binding PadR family transcriptional regulator